MLAACNGGNSTTPSQTGIGSSNGNLTVMVGDDASEDWAIVGVKVLSISLIPQGGGTPVPVYTAPTPAPMINLVQLDQLAEILGNVQVSAGTYTQANISISGNPGDVMLRVSADPEPGFPLPAGTTVPSSQIQIQGTNDGTATVKVDFVTPLQVSAGQSNALELEFDLAHPAFIVEHMPPSGTPFWAVSFKGPLRHHLIPVLAAVLLRHMYGTVTGVSSDNTSMTITKDFPVEPPTTPETAITTSQSLTILADATNGTIFYDVDAQTSSVIKNFSSVSSSLPGKYVRVAARFQPDGSLVAVRIWASSSFNSVWVSPEGHVLHVNTSTDVLTVQNEDGTGVPISVDSSTEFFFRTPANALADATPIGTGTGFLSNIVRGFKVHVSVVDPLASQLVAQTVDIELARYDGSISSPNDTDFTYTRAFATASDDYTMTLPYISADTPNGKDASGNSISGFKWWDFTFPTVVDSGANAISDFVTATDGSVSFGNSLPALKPWGVTGAWWGDTDNPSGWRAPWTVLLPTPMPLATVATAWATNANGGSIGVGIPNGTNTVTVNLISTTDSATLVYQVDRTGQIVTVTPQDITTSQGLANISSALSVLGTPVKVFGVPQPDGTVRAYVLFYFTGTVLPAS
jgi:hypothetical protein